MTPVELDASPVVEQSKKIIDALDQRIKDFPQSENTRKPYEDYRMITDTSSDQYKLLQKGVVQNEGTIYVDGYYAAALGSRFGRVGERYIFVLQGSEGRRRTVRIIKGDEKQEVDTLNSEGWLGKDGHVLEMIIDSDYLPSEASLHGSYDVLPEFEGKVVAVFKED